MPIFFASLWQTQNISIMFGMSNSSVVPRMLHAELLVANISISSKNRMTISTLFMKFNLYGLVLAWIQEVPAKRTHCISDVCTNIRSVSVS